MRRWLIAVCLSFVIDAGCRSSPRLAFQKGTNSDAEYLVKVFTAPIVIVGVIKSDTLVRGPIYSDGMTIQLRRLKVRVENILRGNALPETVTVYYFTWAGGSDGPKALGFWKVPAYPTLIYRRIFWLRRDSGVLRTACDGWDECTMPADSGAHPNYRPDPKKPLGYALADVFFTRGNGVTDTEFARQVEWGAPSTVPEAYLFEKLQRLAATEVPAVREAACEQLSRYRQKCVETMGKP
jgi:hypothetical protein